MVHVRNGSPCLLNLEGHCFCVIGTKGLPLFGLPASQERIDQILGEFIKRDHSFPMSISRERPKAVKYDAAEEDRLLMNGIVGEADNESRPSQFNVSGPADSRGLKGRRETAMFIMGTCERVVSCAFYTTNFDSNAAGLITPSSCPSG